MNNRALFSRWSEIILVFLLLAFGVGLRVAYPGRMAVEHYDEGIYASNMWFDAAYGYEYPQRFLYAPPLLPGLIEWSILFFGTSFGPFIPSLLAGCISLGVVWWMARQWLGPIEAIIALALIAFSEIHLLYTRMALTEALLIAWMLLALNFFVKAIALPTTIPIIGAGVSIGLAWWTKYNGWLPICIALAGIILWITTNRPERQAIRQAVFGWLAVSSIACAVWSVEWLALIRDDAWDDIVQNHRSYVVGLSGWWQSLKSQITNLRLLESPVGCSAPAVALLLAVILWRPSSLRSIGMGLPAVVVLAAIGWRAGSSVLTGLLSLGGIICLLGCQKGVRTLLPLRLAEWFAQKSPVAQKSPDPFLTSRDHHRSIGHCVLVTWFGSLFFLTPLYHPFPRLTLPWLASAWLLSAIALTAIANCFRNDSIDRSSSRPAWIYLRAGLIFLATGISIVSITQSAANPGFKPPPALAAHDEIRNIAKQILETIHSKSTDNNSPAPEPAVVFVYAEPAMLYQLKAAGARSVTPLIELQLSRTTTTTTFLITGPHAHRSPQYQDEWPRYKDWFEPLSTYIYTPSDVLQLNLHPPARFTDELLAVAEEFRLYIVRPVHD